MGFVRWKDCIFESDVLQVQVDWSAPHRWLDLYNLEIFLRLCPIQQVDELLSVRSDRDHNQTKSSISYMMEPNDPLHCRQ